MDRLSVTPASSDKVQTRRSLLRRFQLNALGYGYAQLVTLAVQLLLVPFFLKFWGADRYADWLVLAGIPSMLTLLDLGVAQALASKATTEASAGRFDEARTSLQTALVFTLGLCAALMAIASIASHQINWSRVLGLETINESDAATVVLVMAAYLGAGLMGGPLDGWYRTIDRSAVGAFLLANRRMLDVLLSIAVIANGGGVVALSTTLLAGQLLAVTVLYWLAIRWSPWQIFGVSDASWKVFRQTLRPALAYMGFPLAQVITLQGGVQVLNQFASPTIVVAFTMSRTLMRLIMQAGVVANNSLKPEISRLAGEGRLEQARRFAVRASLAVSVSSLVGYAFLIAAGPSIVHWWGRGSVSAFHGDLALIGAHCIVNVVWFVPASALIAINRHVSVSVAYGITSCVALAIWALSAASYSLVLGASLVLLIPEVMAALFTWKSFRRRPAHAPELAV